MIQTIAQGVVALVFVVAAVLNLNGVMTGEIVRLGYPAYFSTILGVAYLIGVVCLYQPRFPFLRDWAFGAMAASLAGGAGSHVLAGDPLVNAAPAILTLFMLLVAHKLRGRRA